MGTNYYLNIDDSPTCHRSSKEKHIGKSSGGWCFALHVYPDEGINDLDDWNTLLKPGNSIRNEYGEYLTIPQLMQIITERSGKGDSRSYSGYKNQEQFHQMNHSQPGPNGLIRHKIEEGHCIKHGSGTWDCIVGDFS